MRVQHRQGWFTYAYCHNSHVRQFHELQRPNQQRLGKNTLVIHLFSCHTTNVSLYLGEYKPEEDTEVCFAPVTIFVVPNTELSSSGKLTR